MRSVVLALTTLLVMTLASGCLVRTRTHNHGRARVSERCHPSEFWNGDHCEHKGRGHGKGHHKTKGKGR